MLRSFALLASLLLLLGCASPAIDAPTTGSEPIGHVAMADSGYGTDALWMGPGADHPAHVLLQHLDDPTATIIFLDTSTLDANGDPTATTLTGVPECAALQTDGCVADFGRLNNHCQNSSADTCEAVGAYVPGVDFSERVQAIFTSRNNTTGAWTGRAWLTRTTSITLTDTPVCDIDGASSDPDVGCWFATLAGGY